MLVTQLYYTNVQLFIILSLLALSEQSRTRVTSHSKEELDKSNIFKENRPSSHKQLDYKTRLQQNNNGNITLFETDLHKLQEVVHVNNNGSSLPQGLKVLNQRRQDSYSSGGYEPNQWSVDNRSNSRQKWAEKAQEWSNTDQFEKWPKNNDAPHENHRSNQHQKSARNEWVPSFQGGSHQNFANHNLMPQTSDEATSLVKITDMSVPEIVRVGEDVVLKCKFEVRGENTQLYTVNWWKGNNQFYIYHQDKNPPHNAFSFEGLQVDIERSNRHEVRLLNVSEQSSGSYKCEVMMEAPAFKTAVKIRQMKVIVPPETVYITTLWDKQKFMVHRYTAGEAVSLTCVAKGAKPRAELSWKINDDKMITPAKSIKFNDYIDQIGRVTTSIELKFFAPTNFIGGTSKVECIANVEGHLVRNHTKLYLDSAASALYNHQFSRASGSHMALVWLLITTTISLL